MIFNGRKEYIIRLFELFQGDNQRIKEYLDYCNNELFEKIHIMSRKYAPHGVHDDMDVQNYLQSNLEGVIILDRNVLSEMLGALKRGSFSSPNNPNSDAERKKITAFILWASLHNMSLCPYWGVNEFAHNNNAKVNGNKELDQFNAFFDTISIETIRESFFSNSVTFRKRSFSEAIDNETFQFDEDDGSHLYLYAAMLHFVYILNITNNKDEQFELFINWYFENCLFSRYVVAYIFLYFSRHDIKPPHNYTNKDKAIKGCSNMARDIQYIQDLDRIELHEKAICSNRAFFFATNDNDICRYFSAGNDNSYFTENKEQFWQYLCGFLNESKQYTYFTICNAAYRTHIMPKVTLENAVYTGKKLVEEEKRRLENYFADLKK